MTSARLAHLIKNTKKGGFSKLPCAKLWCLTADHVDCFVNMWLRARIRLVGAHILPLRSEPHLTPYESHLQKRCRGMSMALPPEVIGSYRDQQACNSLDFYRESHIHVWPPLHFFSTGKLWIDIRGAWYWRYQGMCPTYRALIRLVSTGRFL